MGRPPVPLDGRTAIGVDDGIATRATVRVALQTLASSGTARRVVLAIPVAPREVAATLDTLCDEVIILLAQSPQ